MGFQAVSYCAQCIHKACDPTSFFHALLTPVILQPIHRMLLLLCPCSIDDPRQSQVLFFASTLYFYFLARTNLVGSIPAFSSVYSCLSDHLFRIFPLDQRISIFLSSSGHVSFRFMHLLSGDMVLHRGHIVRASSNCNRT